MTRLHTLTYNETTYNINDGKTTNDIFINGFKSDWYIEYELKKIDDNIVVPTLIKLKNRNDSNSFDHYLAMNTTSLQFNNVVDIINTINENK